MYIILLVDIWWQKVASIKIVDTDHQWFGTSDLDERLANIMHGVIIIDWVWRCGKNSSKPHGDREYCSNICESEMEEHLLIFGSAKKGLDCLRMRENTKEYTSLFRRWPHSNWPSTISVTAWLCLLYNVIGLSLFPIWQAIWMPLRRAVKSFRMRQTIREEKQQQE